MSEAECTYDAPQMAELLFSDASPALVLAAHRLLRDDRALFRQVRHYPRPDRVLPLDLMPVHGLLIKACPLVCQVGRLPPRYQPRTAAEVEALRAQQVALAEARLPLPSAQPVINSARAHPEEPVCHTVMLSCPRQYALICSTSDAPSLLNWANGMLIPNAERSPAANQKAAAEAALVQAMADAMAAPRAAKPDQDAWHAGPHGPLLAAAQALALGEPAAEDAAQWAAGSGKLAVVLRGLRLPPTADGAAALLKGVGWWPRHLPVRLLRAQVTLQMPRTVEVCTWTARRCQDRPHISPTGLPRLDTRAST